MKIVILGAGRVGLNLAKQLIDEKKEVVLIEKDIKKAEQTSRQLDCLIINDAGNNLEALQKADTAKADFFISLTESDETNMIACALVSSTFEKPVTIARVRNTDYSQTWNRDKQILGIDHIVNPEIEVAKVITNAIESGAVSSIVTFETSAIQMRNFTVQKGSPFSGIAIKDLRNQIPADFIVGGIRRNEKVSLPDGETIIAEGDHLWVLAGQEDFTQIFKQMDSAPAKMERVVIAGGGNIGSYITRTLLEGNQKTETLFSKLKSTLFKAKRKIVHIIDHDYERCKELSELYPQALVTNADISEEQILEEERFLSYDLLITATGNQEMNIITAAHAKKLGMSRTMALVRKISYAATARELGIDVAVSVNETLINSLLKIIRKGNVRTVYTLADSSLEIMEMSLEGKSKIAGRKIQDIHLPKDSLILMVSRQGEHIIPYGALKLEPEDHLLIIAEKESIKDLE